MNCAPPKYTVTVQGRPQASVATLGRPAVVSVTVPGPQGPRGDAGPMGERGPPARFGQLRVADMRLDPEDYFAADVRQQLIFEADPAQTQNFLQDPFKSVAWVNNRIMPRPNGYGDWQDIIVNLLVVPQFGGGSIVADLDVGSSVPVQTDSYELRGSGVAERVTFRMGTQTLNSFQTNGAAVYLTGTVPFTIQSEAIVYLPLSTGPTP